MFYNKKPVVIEAFIYEGNSFDCYDDNYIIPEWAINAYKNGIISFKNTGNKLNAIIKTLEGDMVANVGDYIIKGVNGKLYPCKPDIFEKTYQPIWED